MYERDQGEILRLKFEVENADVTITGLETVVCELRKSAPVISTAGAAALVMGATFVPSAGAVPDGWLFEGSTSTLSPGTYDFGAWIVSGAERVSLGGGKVKITRNAAALP